MAFSTRTASLLLVGLLSATTVQAATSVAWVSFHPGDLQPSTTAASVGFEIAPDIGYTSLLSNKGYDVTRVTTFDNATPASLAFLNDFDLVIISRSVPSGHYQTYPGEVAAWNGLTAPLMMLGGYTARDSRLGFFTGGTMVDTTNNISLHVNNPAHPIFQGVSLDLDSNTTLPYAGIVTMGPAFTNLVQNGISVDMNPIVASGTVLASVATPGNTFGGTIIAEWAPGATSARGDTFAGPRLVFLTGSREAGGFTGGDAAGQYDLYFTGEKMFLNAVDYMTTTVIPEPSTGALALLGGFVWMMFFRRRK